MGAIQNALQRDGLDPSIMDLDPDKSLEYQNAMAKTETKKEGKEAHVKEPAKPNLRRKKFFWSTIEKSKIDNDSMWSMIQGTCTFDSLKVDQNEFESLFTDKSNSADQKQIANDSLKLKSKKKSVQVIDAKRGMNGGIVLASIKVNFSVLAEMVTKM